MPGVVHGGETFTISPGGTLVLTTTWSPGPNQGPVFVMGDPVSGQEVRSCGLATGAFRRTLPERE